MNRKTLFTALLLLLGRNVCWAGESGPAIRFAEIPAGSFYMGSGGPGADYDEAPIHKVFISRPFRMSVTEITNAQYEAFDPSHRALRGKQGFSSGDDEAVIFVDWHQADAFCRWLSERRAAPTGFRPKPNGNTRAGPAPACTTPSATGFPKRR